MNLIRTRLAPTPSGLLHPGNGLSFIMTWCLARAAGGEVLLRIDDLDKGRRRREYLEDIFSTLDWLGLDWDIGPSGVEDFLKRYSQHRRLDLYFDAVRRLQARGLLFACTCSRRQILKRAPSGLYPGTCREQALPFDGAATAWRIRVAPQTEVRFREWKKGFRLFNISEAMGDFVVRQKNGFPAYQVASLVDDLHFGIDFIVRGEDLLPSTAAQIFLAGQLSEPAFLEATFWHHGLLTDPAGGKLSKSKGAGSLREWRLSSRSPEPLIRQAAAWLGVETTGDLSGIVDQLKE